MKTCLISSCTENYSPYDFFARTLHYIPLDGIFHKKIDVPDDLKKEGWGFFTPSYNYCVKYKINYLIEVLSRNIEYDLFIFSDCDIQFFPKKDVQWSYLFEYIENNEAGVFFMRENYEKNVNTGFFIIKNSYRLQFLKFLKKCVNSDDMRRDIGFLGDQYVINKYKKEISFGYIPSKYVIWGTQSYKRKDKCILHHAVCTSNCAEKLDQLNMVWEAVTNRKHMF